MLMNDGEKGDAYTSEATEAEEGFIGKVRIKWLFDFICVGF